MSIIYGSPLFLSSTSSQNADLPPLLNHFKATSTEENTVILSADKMYESRANELIGAVWVYGNHEPQNVKDGIQIQLSREEVIMPDPDPYITLAELPVSNASIKTVVNLKESDGKLHPYLYLSNNHNGTNGGLLLREKIGTVKGVIGSWSNPNDERYYRYWCEKEFLPKILAPEVSSQVITGNIKASWTGDSASSTLGQSKCFALSLEEYGFPPDGSYIKDEGPALPYFSSNEKRIAFNESGGVVEYYTRTSVTASLQYIKTDGTKHYESNPLSTPHGLRPAIFLPPTFKIKSIPNLDGSYDMYGDVSMLSSISLFSSSDSTVEKQIYWDTSTDFYARQFTFNSKKQYQTMLEGAIASVIVEGAPATVTDFQISGSGANPVLTWINPIDDELYQETVVIQKQGSEPTDITDGTEIYRGTDQTCTATGLEQSTDYYFAIYTISSLGIYKQPIVKSYRYDTSIYGIKRDYTQLNPEWARTDNAVGFTATASVGTVAGSSDFDSCYPWSEIKRETLSTGDVMVKIPKFWYKRYREGNYEYIKIADAKIDGFELHPAFYHSGKESDSIYVGSYKTSADNNSKSGVKPGDMKKISEFRSNAKLKGIGWCILDISSLSAIQMLILVEFANNNVQKVIGRGYCDSSEYGTIITGSTNSVPNATGIPSGIDGKVDVVWRGIEGLWGNIYEWIDGINWDNGSYYVCNNPSQYAEDTTNNYTKLSFNGATNWDRSYITEEGLDSGINSHVLLPSSAGGGSESTYYCDASKSGDGWKALAHGGIWSDGSSCGLFSTNFFYAASNAYTYFGSRLLYIPE